MKTRSEGKRVASSSGEWFLAIFPYYNAESAVSPNVHQPDYKQLFSIKRIAEPLPNAAQTLENQHFEEAESQHNHILIVLHGICTNIYVFMLGDWKSIVMKLFIHCYGIKSIFRASSPEPR